VERAPGAHAFELVFDLLDAFGDAAAVGLQLRLAGTASADAAAQARHLHAASGQARQQIVELCQFDLQTAFPGTRTRGEDIEDQLSPIDDFGREQFFQITLLGRRQVLVEDHDVDFSGNHGGGQFLDFALSDEGGGFRCGPRLHHAVDDFSAGTGGQFGEFVEGLLGLQYIGEPGAAARLPIQPDQNRTLGCSLTECRCYASEASA